MPNPIRRLLEAEKKAGEVVAAARARKAARVHQAASEVDEEIARYKAQADLECKTQEEEILKSSKVVQRTIELEIAAAVADNGRLVSDNMDRCVQRLIDAISDIKGELHVNYGGQHEADTTEVKSRSESAVTAKTSGNETPDKESDRKPETGKPRCKDKGSDQKSETAKASSNEIPDKESNRQSETGKTRCKEASNKGSDQTPEAGKASGNDAPDKEPDRKPETQKASCSEQKEQKKAERSSSKPKCKKHDKN